MEFNLSRSAQRSTQRQARRFSPVPQLERLEDRIVAASPETALLVATGPSTFSYQDQSSFPRGIIGVEPSTGAQTAISTGGLFSLPTYLTEGSDGQLYVTDLTATGTGAVIAVDPNNGQQRIVARGGFINGPNVLLYNNGFLYVANEGDSSGAIHNLVEVDPGNGHQRLITDGSSGGFTVPTGIAMGPGHTVYVLDEPGNVQGSDPGAIWQVNLDSGQQALIVQGGLLNHPVDMALGANGTLLVGNTGTAGDGYSGSVVRVDPQTGAQTLITSFGAGTGLNSIEVSQDGTIYVGAISTGNTPGRIYAVDPGTGVARLLTSDGQLSEVEGIRLFQAPVPTPATKTTVVSSANPSVFGQQVTLTATIRATAATEGTPTGTVQFQIDGSNLGSPVSVTTTGGVTAATFSLTALAVGSHTVTASYSGDGSFASSTATLSGVQVVNMASTTTAVTSSSILSTIGQTVTFTATVTVASPGAGTPKGTVQFQIDRSNVGSPISVSTTGGITTASFSTTSLTVGSHAVTASYSGDGNFTSSTGALSRGQSVTSPANGNVTATLDAATGVLTISGDSSNNAVTIVQAPGGALQVAGAGTTVNQSSNPANFSAVTGISVSLLNGNISVTMSKFSISGALSITAGAGSDVISLDTIGASNISITTAGPGKDTINLTNTSAAAITVASGDNATLVMSGGNSGSVSFTAGFSATVSVNGLTTSGDLTLNLGDNAQSVTVKGSNVSGLNIQQSGVTGESFFDLENDTLAGSLSFSSGSGNNSIVMSHLNIAALLLVSLGAGRNTVTADHVTALFGYLDGGPGGNNIYNDGGGNTGYVVIHFLGH